MTDWVEPQTIKEWSRRVFGMRPVLATLLIASVVILEMRFDWVERALGAYLVTTNAERPESGAIWEKGRRTLTARKTLEKIVTDRQTSQRAARNAGTFSQIAASLSPDKGVMLSADHFRRLYLNLPPVLAREVISAFDLLKVASEGDWRRTYFENSGQGLTVYLLDAENSVLQRIDLPPNVLLQLDGEDIFTVETLEDLPNFKNRIYSAERFFKALDAFPEEVRRNVLPRPEMLLKPSGRIVRVGISDEAVSGFIELGFEILNGSQRKIFLAQGHEWGVWQLRASLEGKKFSAAPLNEYMENQTPR